MTSIKQEFEGTKQFEPMQLKAVLKDKVIYLSKIDENGGKGDRERQAAQYPQELREFLRSEHSKEGRGDTRAHMASLRWRR